MGFRSSVPTVVCLALVLIQSYRLYPTRIVCRLPWLAWESLTEALQASSFHLEECFSNVTSFLLIVNIVCILHRRTFFP